MIIIYLNRLLDFGQKHANARKSLSAWKNKMNVLADFPRAKMIRNNRARFEIVHNQYRLIAHIFYEEQVVEIRFIGTHHAYENIDPETI